MKYLWTIQFPILMYFLSLSSDYMMRLRYLLASFFLWMRSRGYYYLLIHRTPEMWRLQLQAFLPPLGMVDQEEDVTPEGNPSIRDKKEIIKCKWHYYIFFIDSLRHFEYHWTNLIRKLLSMLPITRRLCRRPLTTSSCCNCFGSTLHRKLLESSNL